MCDLCQARSYASSDHNCLCDCKGEYKETPSKLDLESVVFAAGKEKLTIADLGGSKQWFKCKNCGHYVPDASRDDRAKKILLGIQRYKCNICGEHFEWINQKAPKMYLHYTKDRGHISTGPLALDELQILCEKCNRINLKTQVRRLR